MTDEERVLMAMKAMRINYGFRYFSPEPVAYMAGLSVESTRSVMAGLIRQRLIKSAGEGQWEEV